MSTSPDLLSAAEANCAAEPIDRPGAIQPHGILLLLREGAIRAQSRNAPGRSLATILTAESVARLDVSAPATLSGLQTADGRTWTGLLRPHAEGALLELEPSMREGEPLDGLDRAMADLQAASDVARACEVAAGAIAAMTGFDRVMAYRFLPDWSGEVLAERLRLSANQSFRGLRFPASDIPAQARTLYAGARVRTIPDRLAEPVPIEPPDPFLDLSASILRAVSPLHLRYLANMGVRASMSVAILSGASTLWGLIACHHETGPLLVGHRTRRAADMVARALAWRVAELETAEIAEGRARLGDLRELLVTTLADPSVPLDSALAAVETKLLGIARADGFTLCGPAGPIVLGQGTDAGPDALSLFLDAHAPSGRLVTDRLAELAPDALHALGDGGLLACRLNDGTPGTWAAWHRRGLAQSVDWAGDPDKTAQKSADGVPTLSPRHSFAVWREEVHGRSEPFSAADRSAAETLAETLIRALLRRTEAFDRINRDLRQRNDEIRFFADAAVHDLREPLWQIQVFSGLLREDVGALTADAPAAAELASMAGIVESSAVRMRGMIDDLSQFASAGRRPAQLVAEPLARLADEAATDLAEQLRACGGSLDIDLAPDHRTDRPLALHCDGGQVRRLLQNLISNAIKYRDLSRTLQVRLSAEPAGTDALRIVVADNGVGFDPADREQIFEPFKRLQPGVEREGMGLGLAISRRIVEGHGGSIEADATPGAGARFTVVLPTKGPAA